MNRQYTPPFMRSIWLLLLVLLGSGCSGARNAAEQSATQPSTTIWQRAAEPYSGVVLQGITEDSPPSLYVRDVLAPQFEAETGIQIELAVAPHSEVERAIVQGGAGYDFVYLEQDLIYGYLQQTRLVNLSQMLTAHPDLAMPAFDLTDFTDFADEFRDPADGALYGVPIEAFIKAYAYRKDLFEDPAIRALFENEFSYPLAPAVTFDQYQDIAAFFTRYGIEQGLDLWGSSLQAKVGHDASFYEFVETIAPGFGIYNWGINLDTNRATEANGGALDSAQAKSALRFWLTMLDYAPPDASESSWDDVAAAFGAGRVAQGWLYGEYIAALGSDTTDSQVVGKLGVALPPTAPGVIEDAIVGAGYLGYYDGAAFGIPVDSRQQEAALLWLQYLGQPSVQPGWAAATSRVVHISTFDNPLVQTQDQRLNGYYTLMKKQGQLFGGAPPMPYHAEVRDTISPYIHQAITGDLSADEALDQAALAVDALLASLEEER